jgi:hypothetical protein
MIWSIHNSVKFRRYVEHEDSYKSQISDISELPKTDNFEISRI